MRAFVFSQDGPTVFTPSLDRTTELVDIAFSASGAVNGDSTVSLGSNTATGALPAPQIISGNGPTLGYLGFFRNAGNGPFSQVVNVNEKLGPGQTIQVDVNGGACVVLYFR